MKLSISFCSLCLFLLVLPIAAKAQQDEVLEKRIRSLVAQMTIEEKIGQTAMRGTSSRVKGTLPEALKNAVREGKVGAMLNVMNKDYVDELQRIAVEESPHGIPLIFGRDIIHGFKTIFPIPLGIAASWDTEVAKTAARISAVEGASGGIRWTFAPMLDICRDSRWGRIAESPGEDPFLGALMGRAWVEGFQGEDLTDPTSMAACAKHFLGYGAAMGGRDYNTVIIHEPLLRNVYLPPFRAAIEAGALTVMTAFNELNGIPASGNEFLLQQVLRDDLSFDGFVVSDWNSIIEMIPHGYARDQKQAAEQAFNAGLDMEMMSQSYENNIKTLLNEGKVTVQQLDFLVSNILRVKFKMGLFEIPFRPKDTDDKLYHSDHLTAAKEAAVKSMVLLKNEALLPLRKGQKVAIIGPLANAPREQLGTWTFDGEAEKTITPVGAFEKESFFAGYSDGLAYSRDTSQSLFSEAIRLAETADVILFFGGEEAILSGEAHSRANIDLPGEQEALIKLLAQTGKPVVLIIMAGRPITISNIIGQVDAVLMAWHPGTMGGPAIHDVLMGISEPGGRLPVTWPKTAGQLPLFYNHKNTGRPADSTRFVHIDDIPVGAWQSSLGNNSHYLDAGFTPHFPFGYGLTYADFSYSNLELSSNTLKMGASLEVTVNITNTGKRRATEVAQLYIRDVTGSITRPVRELKGFKHVVLEAGETRTVGFFVVPEDLKFVNNKLMEVIEPGDFEIWVGPNAQSGLKTGFEFK
ncbi:MAG: glycoside hydrolase family 3 C-terminal domain-containing protein [Lewinellaceae bacterium]|nr:glycoside hydrolase family 3 C-terminal domain-containing protein [Lewinellaceae bacterium]